MPAAYLKAPDLHVVQYCRKVPYDSRWQALQTLRKVYKASKGKDVGIGKLEAYRCVICAAWHLGHRTINPKEAA